MTIQTMSHCRIEQDAAGNYAVVSKNGIILHSTGSIVSAYEYAEWWEKR